MTPIAQEVADLYRRDLAQLKQELVSFPGDDLLWQVLPGLANSTGNLALHLEGNLREYIGRQLGGIPYQRERPLEFSLRDISLTELITRITEVEAMVPQVVESLDENRLSEQYPEVVLNTPMSVRQFLIHLHGHLMFHLAQINDLRCAFSAGAVPQ